MVSRNRELESWQKDMYWKNFNFARFSLILPHDFHHRLVLPEKFTKYMRNQLPEKVVLKVNGLTWNVDVEQDKYNVMLQGTGWKKFAKAYSLKKSDILTIKYDKRGCFKVYICDHADSCEREASYFVRKDQQPKSNDGDDSGGEEFIERNQGREIDRGYTSGSRLRKNSNRARKGYSSDTNSGDERDDDISDEENSISDKDCTTPKKASTCNARKRKVSGEETTAKKKRACATCYKSNRRQFTEEEKKIALEKAKKTCMQHPNSFVVVMRPTSVYKLFLMSIPWEWKPESVFKNAENVILKVDEKTWVCRISVTTTSRRLEGAGWKSFALENFLEEYDVCLFVPSGTMNKIPVLEVSVFRVVPQAVQSSPVIRDDLVNEITSEDSSEGDGDSDYFKRNKHRRNPVRNAHTRENLRDEDESDETSDGEKSSSEEDSTPKVGATPRGREFSSNVSRKRKHYIAEKYISKETRTYLKASTRNISEADKDQVLKMAEEKSVQYKNSFIAVMKTTSVVSQRFFLTITKDWKLRRNMKKGQEVILQLYAERERKWTCKIYMYKHNVGLQSGWKRFVDDNKLKMFDVCLFVPAQEYEEKCILDVHIFRVRSPAVV